MEGRSEKAEWYGCLSFTGIQNAKNSSIEDKTKKGLTEGAMVMRRNNVATVFCRNGSGRTAEGGAR